MHGQTPSPLVTLCVCSDLWITGSSPDEDKWKKFYVLARAWRLVVSAYGKMSISCETNRVKTAVWHNQVKEVNKQKLFQDNSGSCT